MTSPFATAWQTAPGAAIRPSATVVVLRQGAHGMELLLMRRTARAGDIHAGACVFPGGVLDAKDGQLQSHCDGLDDAAANQRLGLDAGGLAYHVAALRECFEEAGLLFASLAGGAPLASDDVARLGELRPQLNAGTLTFQALCDQLALRLRPAELIYFSHWLTPPGVPKRYDTRFFITEAPPLQIASHDNAETVEQIWLTPADALARRAELKLAPPTFKTVQWLNGFDSVSSALAAARALPEVRCIMPRLATGKKGLRPVMPDEPVYAELGHVDPEGRGHLSDELLPGPAVHLSPRLIRVTAPNGSVMTGPGTNTYLMGGGADNEWAVLDPGPDDEAHVQAILAAAPGKIRWIFVTHTHKDHSPAVVALRGHTGAEVLGMAPLHREWQDDTFAPTQALAGGERFELPGPCTLNVIHTPGHAGNHLCYHLEEERMLFTGDHVMQGSTVVINPPDGSMGAYLKSLRGLLSLDVDWLAPGHGFLMPRPREAMERIIAHRLQREAKVLAALPASAAVSTQALLAEVYADVPAKLHAMALRSLTAHLLKLQDDGVATVSTAGEWARV